ncbi:hypothetical protein PV05_05886 [Exophiala xenobiotica]|uniref:Uncharacterized protein n=1 Tax=Exophiala xenobiotica TaxID=348802 RepID=A0A0D2BY12_9EURO|nr:uncharacterized protein PV05_05886 [Exophiala xenobiotica]KIW57321.1 hypothetical protein PV05_05886 [Exophiala xenobiotica]
MDTWRAGYSIFKQWRGSSAGGCQDGMTRVLYSIFCLVFCPGPSSGARHKHKPGAGLTMTGTATPGEPVKLGSLSPPKWIYRVTCNRPWPVIIHLTLEEFRVAAASQ